MLPADGQYQDGDIRLVGGSYQWEGRVEIYFSGTWGTITDSDWTSNDAQVVCRKLGHFKPGAELIFVLVCLDHVNEWCLYKDYSILIQVLLDCSSDYD